MNMTAKQVQEWKRNLIADDHGYTWVCFEPEEGPNKQGLHYFQKPVMYTPKLSQEQLEQGWKPVTERRYAVIRATDEDIENGNLLFFMQRGYTR